MKAKYLARLALAGLLAFGTAAAAAENQNQQNQGGKPGQVRSGGGAKVNAGGARFHAQPQGGAQINRGNAVRIQNQNRVTVQQQKFNRNVTNRNVTNRNVIHRDITRNRTVIKQQNFKQQSVQRNERNRIHAGERNRANRQVAVQISQAQRIRIRESFRRHHWHHVARVGFPIFVGASVPRDYAVYDVPSDLVEYVPEYEGYKYIVVGNELLIIDPETWEIIAVIPV